MKNIIIFAILYFLLALGWLYIRESDAPEILDNVEKVEIETAPHYPFVDQINKRNEKIKSFICDDIKIKIVWKMSAKLKASLYFEKDKNFRFIAKSVVGKECDLGSNKDIFWFWSKRMKDSNLYYSEYKDIYKTSLRSTLHPLWLIESLGFNKIDVSNAVVASITSNGEEYWSITERRLSTANFIIEKITLVKKSDLSVAGHYVFHEGKCLASTEVTEYEIIDEVFVPKKMKINWREENIVLYWEFRNSRVNENVDKNMFNLPNIPNKTNIGK